MIADIFSDKKYIFIAIGFTIVSFFYNNLMFKIIDFFSPNHFVISRTLENIGTFFIDLFMNGYDSKFSLSIQIVVHFFLIIAALIFNEFLVINICGLSKNTKLFLDYEVEREINNEKEGNITMSIIFIFIKIISIILYSFENVLVKYILYYYYMSTYSLLLIKSIFHFTYLILFHFLFFQRNC